ncbi:TPA: hypothetical protein DIC20_01225 [Candidatus Dependentiae bacterium]|nr:MAG: hypothetical protein US03_C0002G0147 [candidate division TM6 bacterium GW2011_GWF2_36_131]KKQ03580.1 MAG: hypothetical protein US13_C0002G0146 [candidate division TM6 bacterium GW2011_GWE2_36_25]KKQ20144.1 MAG: hypothetical protein US32_C0001G0041 [candidate division TM6 bacterium GW2011_GWA2_36_9]HBR70686.1 hypothetical protein [Candidatus Dependentiae bacterium]HCU00306.1 hypothetical protein [Candidatus Dependentiae bacterium]
MKVFLFLFLIFSLHSTHETDQDIPSRDHVKTMIGIAEMLIEEGAFVQAHSILEDVIDCPYQWLALKVVILLGQISIHVEEQSSLDEID